MHLNWARTITPLAEFCRVPYRRKSTTAQTDAQGESADSPRLLALRRDLALAQSEIDALKGKWPFRLAKKLKKLTWLTAPVVYPLVFLISAGVAVAAKLSDAANHPRQL